MQAYLHARWRGSPLISDIEDAAQEVFLACFRDNGVLNRADPDHPSSFSSLLFSVTRNVARHAERTQARRVARVGAQEFDADATPSDEATLSRLFDRKYAESVVRTARERMALMADGDAGRRRRVELLRERFEEGKPIRDISREWSVESEYLHREFAKAQREFKSALADVVLETERCSPTRLVDECQRLLRLLRP